MTEQDVNDTLKKIILKCRNSPAFFIENFCKVEHPKAGILPFKLFKYQKKALDAYTTHRYNIYKKTRQCFYGESKVWTPYGPISICNIKNGDVIYTYNTHTSLIETTKVADVYDNGIAECIEVRTRTGHRAIVTPDHLYLTSNGWKEAKLLNSEDIIIEVNDQERYMSVTDSEAIILGYLLTDGYCGRSRINFTNTNWKYLLEFQKHFELLFGEKLKIKKHNNSGFKSSTSKQAYRLCSYNKKCLEWLDKLQIRGLTKINKKIPNVVFEWNNKSIALLLNRMFAADGWYSGSSVNEVGIGQISVDMLHQIKQLLTRFKINSNIYINGSSIPKLRIFGGGNFKRFVENIDIYGKDLRLKITKGFTFNIVKGQIKSVKNISKCKVYDLNVPPHHNYIIDGAVVHNCGVSTLTGAYALWYAMFHSHRKVLIVSKRDIDAMEFMRKNVKLVFGYLPEWMKEIFHNQTCKFNEHEVEFVNGSRIVSMTSSPETLRSNSASLNIIDEAAFMPDMPRMWAGGQPTLVHGGDVIVISTVNGVGNWYWATWMDAATKQNDFNPIEINWWDMDWKINFKDNLGNTVDIAPTKGIVRNKVTEDIDKYGQYWSPWLEEQYRALTQQGDSSKFRQEVLAEFIGSGESILDGSILRWLGEELEKSRKDNPYKIVVEPIEYTDPIGEFFNLDFEKKLWIWKQPEQGHRYVIGFDISGGESRDHTGIEIFDIDTKEQVAELNIKVMPKIAARMAAYLGEWYNHALLVIDSNGMGQQTAQELEWSIGYPNLWRYKQKPTDKGKVGLRINQSHKQTLNKLLRDNICFDGFKIHSMRLYQQLTIYVNLGNGKSGNEPGIGNRDDLVTATGLALLGALDNFKSENSGLIPVRIGDATRPILDDADVSEIKDHRFIMPLSSSGFEKTEEDVRLTVKQNINKFSAQLSGIPRRRDETPQQYQDRVKQILSEKLPKIKQKKQFFKNNNKVNRIDTGIKQAKPKRAKKQSIGFKSALDNKNK